MSETRGTNCVVIGCVNRKERKDLNLSVPGVACGDVTDSEQAQLSLDKSK